MIPEFRPAGAGIFRGMAHVGGGASEPLMSEIGTLLPIALCGRNLFHNAHLSMLLKGISFPDLEAILWGASGFAGRDQGSDALLGTRVLNG